jgi:UDP-N-acetylglucosamine transferase subunit ALG13
MFVTVGTDHHPFERLVDWAARWAERMPEWDVQIQHGQTRAPAHGTAFAFCDRERLLELVAGSDLVVCHGGPATITEARRQGHRPIVVPRDPERGEHVDDHQQLFARRLAAAGTVELVETEDAFLAAAVTAAYLPRQRAEQEEVPEGVLRVGRIAEDLVSRRKRPARREA